MVGEVNRNLRAIRQSPQCPQYFTCLTAFLRPRFATLSHGPGRALSSQRRPSGNCRHKRGAVGQVTYARTPAKGNPYRRSKKIGGERSAMNLRRRPQASRGVYPLYSGCGTLANSRLALRTHWRRSIQRSWRPLEGDNSLSRLMILSVEPFTTLATSIQNLGRLDGARTAGNVVPSLSCAVQPASGRRAAIINPLRRWGKTFIGLRRTCEACAARLAPFQPSSYCFAKSATIPAFSNCHMNWGRTYSCWWPSASPAAA